MHHSCLAAGPRMQMHEFDCHAFLCNADIDAALTNHLEGTLTENSFIIPSWSPRMGKAAAEARYSAVLHPCDTTAADCWQSPLGLQVLRTVQRLGGATRGVSAAWQMANHCWNAHSGLYGFDASLQADSGCQSHEANVWHLKGGPSERRASKGCAIAERQTQGGCLVWVLQRAQGLTPI